MTPGVKDPPKWNDEISYEDYKKEIEVWQLLGSVTKDEEEGPLIYRQLTGKAKAAANELSVAFRLAEEDATELFSILELINYVAVGGKLCISISKVYS